MTARTYSVAPVPGASRGAYGVFRVARGRSVMIGRAYSTRESALEARDSLIREGWDRGEGLIPKDGGR